MDVCVNQSVAGNGPGLLRDLAETLLLNDLDRLFFVAVGLTKRVAACHHPGAGAITQ